MKEVFSIISTLIIAFIGVVAPIIILMLSLFQVGLKHLRDQYENQRNQSETKLREQLLVESKAPSTDIDKIKKTIADLEKIKKTATTKLALLNPLIQIRKIFGTLFLSLIILIVAQIIYKDLSNSIPEELDLGSTWQLVSTWLVAFFGGNLVSRSLILVSIGLFSYSIYSIWNLMSVIIDIRTKVDEQNEERENKKIDLLSSLLELSSKTFLKRVYIAIDSKKISDNKQKITLPINEKGQLKISIVNSEKEMAKNVEVGMLLPYDFIIDKSSNYTIYSDEEDQVVRFDSDAIHGNTRLESGTLSFTPIKLGQFKIKTFTKGENVPAQFHYVNIIVE